MDLKQPLVITMLCLVSIKAKQHLNDNYKSILQKHGAKIAVAAQSSNITQKLIHDEKYFNKKINTKGTFKNFPNLMPIIESKL